MKGLSAEVIGFLVLFVLGIIAGFVILYLLSPMLAAAVGVVGIVLLAVPVIIMAMSGSAEKINR